MLTPAQIADKIVKDILSADSFAGVELFGRIEEALCAEREVQAELLAACKKAIVVLDIATADGLNQNWEAYVALRDAIARAKESQP